MVHVIAQVVHIRAVADRRATKAVGLVDRAQRSWYHIFIQWDAVWSDTRNEVIHQTIAIQVSSATIWYTVTVSVDTVELVATRVHCSEWVTWDLTTYYRQFANTGVTRVGGRSISSLSQSSAEGLCF